MQSAVKPDLQQPEKSENRSQHPSGTGGAAEEAIRLSIRRVHFDEII
jgi:hypothetical protein